MDTRPSSPETSNPLDRDLPSEDRRRIIAEEEFRKRVALRIDHQLTSRRARLLRGLNTPVAIWALSTLVVGLATWGYQRFTESQRAEAEHAALQAKSTNELLYRLSACDRIDSASTRDDVENLLSSVIGLRPLHQEYQGRNLSDVYLEFCALGGICSVPPDTLLAAAAGIRRATWSEIVGQPIARPLKNRDILPGLQGHCARLQPIRVTARATLAGEQ